ncbi:hypothetical protein Scep_009303 [Stephania cephalantha]|uniref:Uncharacterized protein n=1 Tax=Stephania cephalantha TaxID=152367 RepID=A0AAP0JVB9_9MAGN
MRLEMAAVVLLIGFFVVLELLALKHRRYDMEEERLVHIYTHYKSLAKIYVHVVKEILRRHSLN